MSMGTDIAKKPRKSIFSFARNTNSSESDNAEGPRAPPQIRTGRKSIFGRPR